MNFEIQDIIKITKGKPLKEKKLTDFFSISTDSRNITSCDIFLPLAGANFDGHDYIESCIKKGCRAYFIDKNKTDKLIDNENVDFIIEVEDILKAYLELASYYKKSVAPVTIGVTGSSGKTTTKELLYSVLGEKFKTHKSYLNHNNEIGLCQTLLSMPADTQVLIIEMGMRGKGEIEILSKYSQPDISIITNVGTAHIGRLGNRENIALAKCEIVKHMKDKGFFIAHNDDLIKEKCNWNGKSTFYDLEKVSINEHNPENVEFLYKDNLYKLNVSGEYNVLNSIAAIETGLHLGMREEEINKGLNQYSPLKSRGDKIEFKNGTIIINDCYNANPDSVKASVSAILTAYDDYKLTLVLGDMGELGEYEDQLHKDVGTFLNDKNVYELLTIGKKAEIIVESVTNPLIKTKAFHSKEEIVKYIYGTINEKSLILIKASRSMKLETIAQELEQMIK